MTGRNTQPQSLLVLVVAALFLTTVQLAASQRGDLLVFLQNYNIFPVAII